MLGKIEGEKRKRVSEDEMAGWHYQCNEHELDELGQTLEMVRDKEARRAAVHGVTKSWT